MKISQNNDKVTQFINKDKYDDWHCLCGNVAIADGFYPCATNGQEVEPTTLAWKTNCYVCWRCGRIIDAHTLQVVGKRTLFVRIRVLLSSCQCTPCSFIRQWMRVIRRMLWEREVAK